MFQQIKQIMVLWTIVPVLAFAGNNTDTIGTGFIQQEAVTIATRIADKLIRDTRFSFKLVPQKEELGMQVIDFGKELSAGQVGYAMRMAKTTKDTVMHLGISAAGTVTVWLNHKQVYRHTEKQLQVPKENAYNRFVFSKGFDALFKKGKNELLIRYEAGNARPVVFLRPQQANGDLDAAVDFTAVQPFAEWYIMGPFAQSDSLFDPGQNKPLYNAGNGQWYNWHKPVRKLLPVLVIDSSITYQHDAYAEWHYANGNTVWSVMNLANATGRKKYLNFIRQYTGFVLDNKNYFQKQYDSLFAFRGSFHKLFRMTMLDDAGAAVLPFVELFLVNRDPALEKLFLPISEYIINKQLRLPDGTFCRPEPIANTVWADDLFMSVPFLLRMAVITGKQEYFDETVKQFINFRKYLLDPVTGLYKHGWFSNTGQRSVISWGRANGWIAWAAAELLETLPVTHPGYPKVLAAFREQVATLVKYQEANGMWHQVLNMPESYEETSCTAQFTLAIARGVRKGWIDPKYKTNALNGWKAIKSRIDADGTVHGICRGTEIGFDAQFYCNRKTMDQDPRGLGAVITAAIEIAKLQ